MHILALTATATKQTADCVIERLSMKDITVIGDNIDRSNIKYILGPKISQAEFCASLAEELLSLHETLIINEEKKNAQEKKPMTLYLSWLHQ